MNITILWLKIKFYEIIGSREKLENTIEAFQHAVKLGDRFITFERKKNYSN